MSQNLLDQLKSMTVVVADTGDINSIEKFKPRDATTNPSLIAAAAAMPVYAKIVDDALLWAKNLGGLKALIGRADANAKVIYDFIEKNDWIANLAVKPETRSNTSVCLKIVDPDVQALDAAAQADFAKGIVALLEKENVALDIGAYRDAPSGLRIWAGATIETADMEAVMPWLAWAYQTQKAALSKAAA